MKIFSLHQRTLGAEVDAVGALWTSFRALTTGCGRESIGLPSNSMHPWGKVPKEDMVQYATRYGST